MRLRKSMRALCAIMTLSLISVGCTRKKDPSVTLKLSVSGKSGSSTLAAAGDVEMVMINVTAPDMSPVQVRWQRWNVCGSNATCPAPDTFGVQVTKGSNRLIQALVVYEDDTTTTQSFYYGDQVTNVSGDAPVELTATIQGTAAYEGRVAGRFMDRTLADASIGGPTGKLDMFFKPLNGSPPMFIESNAVFAGWFSFFLLDNATFVYKLNGEDFLGGSIGFNSPIFTASPMVLKVKAPIHDRDHGGGQVDVSGAMQLILGYFGTAASGSACYDSRTGQSITGVYQHNTSTALVWNGSSPSALEVGPLSGGVAYLPTGATTGCNFPTNEYVDHLAFHYEHLRNGKDSVSGFRGPWTIFSTGESVQSSTSGSTTIYNWNFLPGVTVGSLGIQGVTAFVHSPVTNNDMFRGLEGDSGFRCSQLGSNGFSPAGETAMTSGQRAATLALTGLSPGSVVVLCPYLNGPNGRFYPDAGARIWSGGGGGSGQVGFKIVGNSSSSRLFGPSLGSGTYNVLKQNFAGSDYNFIFQASHGFLQPGDIQSLDYSVDNGTTWTPVSYGSASFNDYPSTVAKLNMSSIGSALNTDPASNTALKLRVGVTSTAQSFYGLTSSSFTSPLVTAVGTTSCPSPSIALFDVGSSAFVADPNTIMSSFAGPNGTDVQRDLKLRYQGCSIEVNAPLNSTSVSGSMSPTGCFDNSDIASNSADPFLFHISPRDRGSNCSISSFSLALEGPFTSPETVFISGSYTITHSTVPGPIAAVLSGNASYPSGNFNLIADLAFLGASVQPIFHATYINTDNVLIGTSPIAAGTNWSVTPSTWWAGAGPAASDYFSVSTHSAPTGSATVSPITVSYGSANTGSLATLVTSTPFTVRAVANSGMWGGPLMVIQEGTSALKIAVINKGENGGAYTGQGIIYFNMPASVPPNPDWVKLNTFHTSDGKQALWLTTNYAPDGSTQTRYFYGIVNDNSTTINWAPNSSTNIQIIDATVIMDGSTGYNPVLTTLENVPGWAIKYSYPPTWNGTTWSGSAFPVDRNAQFLSGVVTPFGITRCGSEYYVAGSGSGNYFTAQRFNPSTMYANISGSTNTGIFSSTLSGGSSVSGHSNVACVTFGNDSSNPGRAFVTTGGGTGKIHAFEAQAASLACGSAANSEITNFTPDNLLPLGTNSGPIHLADGVLEQWYAYSPSSQTPAKTVISKMGINSCTAGTLTRSSETLMGGVNSTGLLGMTPFKDSYESSPSPVGKIQIFGLGQLYLGRVSGQ